MYMNERSRPKIVRQVEEKRPQGRVPDVGKPQVICKEEQGPNNEPAARSIVVEDEDRIQRESKRSRLKWALGIDDDDFCEGLVYQLSDAMRYDDETNFNFVLSFLKGTKPVDKPHAALLVQMALCHLAATKQSQVLLKPVTFELPIDFQLAIHHAQYDTSRLDKQKIRVDDLQANKRAQRKFGEGKLLFASERPFVPNAHSGVR